jgi:hypothetical protein
MFQGAGRFFNKHLSYKSMYYLCRTIAPGYKVGSELLSRLGVMEFRKRSVREITLDLFDAFTPKYNHRHTPSSVQSWFYPGEFKNFTISGKQKHGFGFYADRRAEEPQQNVNLNLRSAY